MTHPLLAALDEDQAALIQLIGRPIVTDRPLDQFGWPIWDFVRRKFEQRRPGVDASVVLASIPAIQRSAKTGEGPYSLWWRTGHSNAPLAPADRIGLTIPGLHHLTEHLGAQVHELPNPVSVILRLLDEAATAEGELDSDNWWETTRKTFDLRAQLGSRENPPVEVLGRVLLHEYDPLVVPTTNFNFEFALGEGRFSRFGQVADAEDYLSRFPDSAARESVDLPYSPLALPAVLDYLGLLLSDRVAWGRDRRLVQLPDFVSASLVTQLPTGAADFEQRLSALWSVIGRFDVPKAEAAKYEARGWGESRGSINSFEIWLGDHVPEFATSDQCAKAIRTIRNIGTLRQGAQHSSAATRGRALRAQAELGLPMVIIDYPAAWSAVLETLAAAFYSICLGLTLAASS